MTNTHILELYAHLRDDVDALRFALPVSHAYNPLRYAWDGFTQYLAKCSDHPRVVFVGMNPGPWGMAQTGVPFGEVEAVRSFLGIHDVNIIPPADTHTSYPVKGLACTRSEVSGRRLWGLFRDRFTTAEAFLREHVVLNYCPLLFIAEGRNFTPDKLTKDERSKLFALCDECLRRVVEELRPQFVIGIGNFAEGRARESLKGISTNIMKILHPSPASPASNHDWAGKVTRQLTDSEVWQN